MGVHISIRESLSAPLTQSVTFTVIQSVSERVSVSLTQRAKRDNIKGTREMMRCISVKEEVDLKSEEGKEIGANISRAVG
jgi:hypothetical protein